MAAEKKTPVTKIEPEQQPEGTKQPFVAFNDGTGGVATYDAPVTREPEWARPQRGEVPEGATTNDEGFVVSVEDADAEPVEDDKDAAKKDVTVTHTKARTAPPA